MTFSNKFWGLAFLGKYKKFCLGWVFWESIRKFSWVFFFWESIKNFVCAVLLVKYKNFDPVKNVGSQEFNGLGYSVYNY